MKKINPEELIATSKFNRFHLQLIFWGFIIILFDGYDLVVYGTVVPVLIEEWNLSSVEAGAMGSYGLFGMVFGAIVLGMLADRFGRKNIMILSVFLFSFFTMLCGFTDNPTSFSIFRFLAGLGLGGVMPNVIALSTEYAPSRIRNIVVSIVLVSYSVGGMLAPLFGITLMPSLGWEVVFWIAGIPLLLIPFIYKKMPESSSYLIRKGRDKDLIRILSKVNPAVQLPKHVEFSNDDHLKTKVPFVGLFQNKRAMSTILFWTTYFMSLLMVYGLNTWLPNLMIEAGYGLNSSLAFLMVLQGGSIIGTILIARLSMKYDFRIMLALLYAIGGIAITLLGFGGNSMYIYLLVGIAGASSIGAQHLIQAYVSQYYPPAIRSTALGICSGIGRFGGMLGPMLGGFLLTTSLPVYMYFLAYAIPGLIAAIALSIVPGNRAYGKNDADFKDNELLELEGRIIQ
ncbi:MFS transporter [Oceanobacillus piezotolerans]|uniref:MFS transporter n=1 Tax=Oceanobacillus piezotolerans TaxID=2448030 RepID=A0A498DJE3_9BACI|nr:MFS transporter [Oceanobacillus piezotolerans]RLL46582.1 MFS transporter [Oceanobacillus piezotolerans]